MKYLLLALAISASAFSFAGNKDEKDIKAVLAAQVAAWNNGDIEGFMSGYWQNDSLVFIGSKGPTYGYNATLNNYKKSYPGREKMGTLKFTLLHIRRLSPEYYHVTGKWELQRKDDNPNGYFTLLFRNINGKWRIISDHSS